MNISHQQLGSVPRQSTVYQNMSDNSIEQPSSSSSSDDVPVTPVEQSTSTKPSESKTTSVQTQTESKTEDNNDNPDYSKNITKSWRFFNTWIKTNCIPGYVVAASVEGNTVYQEGSGLADIENYVHFDRDTVIRIGSISKPITAAFLAKLVQDKKIDLDASIRTYLTPEQFPDKFWDGQKVDITARHLVSHRSGIRHYKNDEKDKLKEHYQSTTDALSIFKDDPLVAKPGTEYHYTTFGYTLLAAVIESQSSTNNFSVDLVDFLHNELGMTSTCLDQNEPIVKNRARFYRLDRKSGKIVNSPFVDNSYKWAGGGLLSTVGDLLKFGNVMLSSFKGQDNEGRPGFLDRKIVDEMWTPDLSSKMEWEPNFGGYGLGWGVIRDQTNDRAHCAEPPFQTAISHYGISIGASSILLILPKYELVVTILVNLEPVDRIYQMALDVAKIFLNNDPRK